jgi:hypothetical protein
VLCGTTAGPLLKLDCFGKKTKAEIDTTAIIVIAARDFADLLNFKCLSLSQVVFSFS